MVDILAVSKRLQARPDWAVVIEPLRTRMMGECRKLRKMTREEAQQWTYGELDRLYPPEPKPEPIIEPEQAEPQIETEPIVERQSGDSVEQPEKPAAEIVEPEETKPHARTREGIGDIPPSWPDLPPNASLQQEIAWVQAERLRIVAELPSGQIKVNLDQARSPAPSWSALSWLETSIRSYAKYVEVAAKATATAQDEQDQVRRERLDLAEVRSLLDEMRNS